MVAVLLSALMLTALSGCSKTVVKTETIRERVPDVYLVPIQKPSTNTTWGGYAAQCKALIKQCNADKQKIKDWSEQ